MFENIAYDNEKILISDIGTISGESLKRGPLCNFCLDNRPPNHKNKTYYEIYKDKAEEQLKNRHNKQLSVGGYFKGHKHTEESKLKTSIKTKGENNPRYGKEVTQKTRDKISKSNIGKIPYNNWYYKLLAHDKTYYFDSNKIHIILKELNISHSTICKYLNTGKCGVRGSTLNCYLYTMTETEKESYLSGSFKQDMDSQNWNEFNF